MPPTPTPDEEDEVDEQATDAVYEKPRLRVNVKDQAAASGHEAFFNTCFGIALTGGGKIQTFLTNGDHDAFTAFKNFVLYFCAYWFAYRAGSTYAVRYNNTDLSHKAFWTLYGLAVTGMLIHTDGGVESLLNEKYFGISAALCHVLVGLKYFHVGCAIDRETIREHGDPRTGAVASKAKVYEHVRLSTAALGSSELASAGLWLVIAYEVDGRSALGAVVWMAACLLVPLTSSLLEWTDKMVPVSEGLIASSCMGLYTSVLGAGASIVCRVNPLAFGEDQRGELRAAALLGFTIFINLKLVVFDVDSVSISSKHHATNQGGFFKEIWYALQPMIVMSAVALTAGYGLLLDHPTDIPPTKKSIRGRKLACMGCALLIFFLLIQRHCHGRTRKPTQSRPRATALYYFQSLIYLACALGTGWLPAYLPEGEVKASRINFYIAGITAVLVVSAMLDEFIDFFSGPSTRVAPAIEKNYAAQNSREKDKLLP